MDWQYLDVKKIEDMLFNESEFIAEFCEAGMSSFQEFVENYHSHLLSRNLADLRKAGHKIKPGAQMMGADEVVEEYERAKELLKNEAENPELTRSVEKMEKICSTIQEELTQLEKIHS